MTVSYAGKTAFYTVQVSSAFTYGDLNGDGKINGADSTLLQQYLAEWTVTVNQAAADVNGDGTINGADSTLLQQYLAEWDVTIGKK